MGAQIREFDKGDLVNSSSQEEMSKWLEQAFGEETQTVLVGWQPEGSGLGHQVGAIKLGEFIITLDTLKLFQPGVLVVRNQDNARAWLANLIHNQNSFAVKVVPNWN